MGGLYIALVIINLISFLSFTFRRQLDNRRVSGVDGAFDNLALLMAIGGAIGALIAMIIAPNNRMSNDIVFKITIPIGVMIQVAAITYLVLFDLGIVK